MSDLRALAADALVPLIGSGADAKALWMRRRYAWQQAADPQTILALLDRAERAEAALRVLVAHHEDDSWVTPDCAEAAAIGRAALESAK